MSFTEKKDLERVRYWQGQLLRSQDFNDIHAAEEQRRWWHNRAVHNAYGIHQDPDGLPALDVKLTTDKSAVQITTGLAYDSFGRELILEMDQTVPLPPNTAKDEELVLVMRYRMKAGSDCERLAAVCGPNSSRPGFVEFAWKTKQSFCFTDGVALADLQIVKGEKSLKLLQRPSSRPLARPLLASGATVPGNTPWELWTPATDANRGQIVLGVQTTIDTSAAGFTDAPCYFAWLQGPVFRPQTRQIVPAFLSNIAEETVNSFVFRLALLGRRQHRVPMLFASAQQAVHFVTADDFPLFAHQQNLYVSWIGCQKNASAPFLAGLLRNPFTFLHLNVARWSTQFSNLELFASVLNRFNKL